MIAFHHLVLLYTGYKPGVCEVHVTGHVTLVAMSMSIKTQPLPSQRNTKEAACRHSRRRLLTPSLTLYVDDSHARVLERLAFLSAVVALSVGGGGAAGVARQ